MTKKKLPIAVLIGRGSRLPAILKESLKPESVFEIKIVVSHKKLEPDDSDVSGIALAKKHGISAVYFNLPHFRKYGKTREEFEKDLGIFLTQPYFAPELIFMTGWDLLMGENFLEFFPWKNGFYRVINIHPGLLPDYHENDVILDNGQIIPPIRAKHGLEAIQTAIDLKLPVAGSTVHFVTKGLDDGPVISRVQVPIKVNETAEALYQRIQAEEDKMGFRAINLFAKSKLKIEGHQVKKY